MPQIGRKLGAFMEEDWVDCVLTVTDSIIRWSAIADVLVACLTCSIYSYAEVFHDMKTVGWS